jgi:hypothetical protein
VIRRAVGNDAERQVTSEPRVGFNWNRSTTVVVVDDPSCVGEDGFGVEYLTTVNIAEDEIKADGASVRRADDEVEDTTRTNFAHNT